jgi:hypothetical protein
MWGTVAQRRHAVKSRVSREVLVVGIGPWPEG